MENFRRNCRFALLVGLALGSPSFAGELVVVVAPNASSLAKNQIADIYLGRSSAYKPVDLPDSSVIRDAFYQKVTDRTPSQIKAIWARVTFTGLGMPPKVLPDAAAVKKAVAADPKSVGYMDIADVDDSVKVVLALN